MPSPETRKPPELLIVLAVNGKPHSWTPSNSWWDASDIVMRVFHCDAEDCGHHVETHAERPPAFVTVFEEPGFAHERRHEHHFCSWDCVLKYAATVEPGETIPMDEGGEADGI